ncbi:hypothetical protein [Nocardiopsis sp. CA-288880]|uniref:hypothetical protein n=1 Tax=Nocardiopsis sp. CA-288880 TaxID=3239995 RepID=UPI003D98FCC1
MTPQDIRDRVARIEANRDDDETAHSMEDDLYTDVLKAIAGGAPNATELAREALRTVDIDFARWCA